eukprot:14794-Pelagococcus_subviridis.AAC.1
MKTPSQSSLPSRHPGSKHRPSVALRRVSPPPVPGARSCNPPGSRAKTKRGERISPLMQICPCRKA